MMSHYAYGDAIGGLNAAAALLIAVLHRRDTGIGQHVEISQVQCMIPMVAPWLVAQSVMGRPAVRRGTRHPDHAPQDFYKCQGHDQWVLIAILDDAMWGGLWGLIAPGEPSNPAFATMEGRRQHESTIDECITAWTRCKTADDAMRLLQAARGGWRGRSIALRSGCGSASRSARLLAGGGSSWVGRHQLPSLPIRENDRPYPIRHPAPTLGEFNKAVLGTDLGLSDADLDRLTTLGVIGTATLPAKA